MNDQRAGADYRVDFEFSAPLLRATVTGGEDTSLAVTRGYWEEILGEAGSCGASQLLVIDRMRGVVMEDDDLRRFFDAMAGKGFENLRVAYVEGRSDQITRIEVAELIARERGYDTRIFNSETAALIWLRYGGD